MTFKELLERTELVSFEDIPLKRLFLYQGKDGTYDLYEKVDGGYKSTFTDERAGDSALKYIPASPEEPAKMVYVPRSEFIHLCNLVCNTDVLLFVNDRNIRFSRKIHVPQVKTTFNWWTLSTKSAKEYREEITRYEEFIKDGPSVMNNLSIQDVKDATFVLDKLKEKLAQVEKEGEVCEYVEVEDPHIEEKSTLSQKWQEFYNNWIKGWWV